jgi:transposase
VLLNADIVTDRFHVMKRVNAALNRARNAEKKVISEMKDKAQREERNFKQY